MSSETMSLNKNGNSELEVENKLGIEGLIFAKKSEALFADRRT